MTSRQLGINTYSYIWSMTAVECVRHLTGMGFRHFELMINPPHLSLDESPANRRELKVVMNGAGAEATALNMPSLDHNLASPVARVRETSIAMFNDAIDLAADLGAEWLVTVPGRMNPLFPPPTAERLKWIADSVAALIPRAEARGVGLAIENVPFSSFPDAKSLGDFVRGFKSPTVAVCYDAANAHFIGESPGQGIAMLADLLRVMHVSDTNRDVWRHDRVGLGSVPFREVAQALNAIDFDRAYTMEIIDADADDAIRESHRALAKLGFVEQESLA
ncbi:sugar phosphate isomerase/epimerase family protein [Afipia sp. TerB]